MIVALFEREDGLRAALQRLRDARVEHVETYTPAPLHGGDEASPVPLIILVAAVLGGAASFGLQSYSSVFAYLFEIGGRPYFAWASFIPTIFENAVLAAVIAGFAAFMIVNGFPRLYDPVDEASCIRTASSDGWVLAVRDDAPSVAAQVRGILSGSGALHIEQVPS